MNDIEKLQKRLTTIKSNTGAPVEAVTLLEQVIILMASNKLNKNRILETIKTFAADIEASNKLQQEINHQKPINNLMMLIKSTSSQKNDNVDKSALAQKEKNAVDEKIKIDIKKINVLIREDGPIEFDFQYVPILENTIQIIAYTGPKMSNMKIPNSINGKTVTGISKKAFAGNAMDSVTLPNELIELGEGAFQNCKNLKSITCSPKLALIPKSCFEGCDNLKEIIFNDRLEMIAPSAFKGISTDKIKIPASVTTIANNAFQSSTSMKVLFEGNNKSLTLEKNSFSSPAILYYSDSEMESILNKAANAQVKVSGNTPEFFGDKWGSIFYKIKKVIVGILTFILGLVLLVIGAIFNLIRTPIGLGIAGIIALYFAGHFVYDKYFAEKDEAISKVGSVMVQLNDKRGVDQTVVNYNSYIQGLYETALKKNSAADAAAFKSIFIKSCNPEESEGGYIYYYAILNNNDYICFQSNAAGYISVAYIWLSENHNDIVRPVLEATLRSVMAVDFKDDIREKILDDVINHKETALHSLNAKRDFKISVAKKENRYQYIIKAFQ